MSLLVCFIALDIALPVATVIGIFHNYYCHLQMPQELEERAFTEKGHSKMRTSNSSTLALGEFVILYQHLLLLLSLSVTLGLTQFLLVSCPWQILALIQTARNSFCALSKNP